MVQKATKKKRRGKLIKCTNPKCKKIMDLSEERELGNVIEENGVVILYCDCGNNIIVK